MRRLLLILVALSSCWTYAQTFTSSPSLTIPSTSTVTDNITVTGVGTIDCDYGLQQVCIDIEHTWVEDLDIFLIDPEGNSYELTTDNGGGGVDYSVTCFDMTAVTNITAGAAPFNGSFIPEGNIGMANNGQDADGTWTLQIVEDEDPDSGTLDSWNLVFGATPPCDEVEFTASPGTTISGPGTITSNQTVTGVGVIGCFYGLAEVCVDIEHDWDADLSLTLTDPAGNSYDLSSNNGGNGDDYSVTCFKMSAATAITAGTPPYDGEFIPEDNIGLANNGQNANGTWSLSVNDNFFLDDGVLNSWTLKFGRDPDCPPVTTEDCSGATTICDDGTFTGNSSGGGNISDLTGDNDGCLNGEHESSWYYFRAEVGGTFAFEIRTAVDYDFAVWGPLTGVYCPPKDPPIRCSYSGTLGTTGLRVGSGDNSEGSGGNAFVDPITAATGDIFILLIDNFTSDGTSFDVSWTLTDGAVLDCVLLPIELISFTGENDEGTNVLEWKTASEIDNSHYTIERSTDGVNWTVLDEVSGAGNSSTELTYQYSDSRFENGINYYRLSQTDFDGQILPLDVILIDNGNEGKSLEKIINLMGQEVDASYEGLKVYIYTDGSMRKVVSK